MKLRLYRMADGTPENLTFVLTGGPIDQLDHDLHAFTAIGHAAMAWARLEKHIDILLIQINKQQHGEPLRLFDPDHPRAFSGKLKLLKRYFNRHPALTQYKSRVSQLAGEMKTAATDRNTLLHSILDGYDDAEGTLTLQTITYEGHDEFTFAVQKITVRDVIDLARKIVDLNDRLAAISRIIFTDEIMARLAAQP